MKKLFTILLLGTSLSASAIGHPYNLFTAHQKAKRLTPSSKPLACQQMVQKRSALACAFSWITTAKS
ncbi:hypothetical protein [Tellurirhabdus bombi]|uniref:hypothetical protein n=1 Tax=Tellurirhabdus bombi TaxID=2907205 RepID=UPI001F43E386|nr:hypothetical protein [Tellurirhabdus bombi]